MGPIFPPLEPELENLPPPISSHSMENTDQDPPPPSPTLETFDEEDQEEILDLPPPGDDEGSDPPADFESEVPPPGDDEADSPITLESMKENFRFIQMVQEATLATQFSPAELHSFENPQAPEFSLSGPLFPFSS